MSISSHRCHLKQLSSSHRAIHTDMFALCRTTFPRGPTLREREIETPPCVINFFPISPSIRSPPPPSISPCCYVLMCLIIQLRDMSQTHTHVQTNTHTLIITLRDMSTLSPFSRGQWEAFMHIKRTLFLLLPFF